MALLVDALFGWLGANQQSKAADKSLAANQKATDQSLGFLKETRDQTRADQEPFRQAGIAALNPLMAAYGVGAGAAGTQPDWDTFVRSDPAMMENFEKYGRPNGMNEAQFGEWFDGQYGSQDGRDVPTMATPGAAGQPGTFGPEIGPRNAYERPEMGARPGFGRPDIGNRPSSMRNPAAARAPDAALDVSLNAFTADPGYQFRQNEASRAIMANQATRGLMGSGSTLKALQDRAMGIAGQTYDDWRNYTTGQYNTNRQVGDARYSEDRAYGANTFESDRAFGQNAFMDDRNFLTRAYEDDRDKSDARFDSDRQYGTSIYDADRAYRTNRFDQRISGLNALAGFGTGANAANQNAGQNYASGAGTALSSNAYRQSNAYGQKADAWSGFYGGLNASINNAGNAFMKFGGMG